ncbi:MAG: hypothetical protein V9E93_13445 [Steroidobacteraceae bacterium]|nr:hypothetical protein [Pseudomonadota bacterium]MBP6108241.1 hypothetical protein [Steroidobacteraceae bacterium]MBP7015251.1 hypothetical protein [Steroidobacteraceae bacterium]
MAVQSISPEDLSRGLPPVIGLPRCLPARPAYRKTPLGQVMVADELPPYLLLGTLDRSAFQSSDADWSARWTGDVPETHVEATFDRGERRLELHQVWRGIEGGTSFTTGDDFGHAIQFLYTPFPERWDRAMTERLEAAYRLKYFEHRADQVGFTGIPDGGFKTICVPVPVSRLADLYQCFEDMSRDARLKAPVSGRLELRFSTINYVVGKSPAWTQDPARLFAATMEAGGLPPLGLPQLEHAKDGSSAWTVRRWVYLATIGGPFAGVEFVVERLAERGFVRRGGPNADHASDIEFDAFVRPCAIELQGRSVAWMDAQATRRVFYLLNSDEELAKGGVERMMEATAQTEDEARAMIEQAVHVSALQRARFERTVHDQQRSRVDGH